MRETPKYKFPYPDPGDNTQTWVYWQKLAEACEKRRASDQTAASFADLVFNNTDNAGLAITFPVGVFTSPPAVVGSSSSGRNDINISCGWIVVGGFTMFGLKTTPGPITETIGCSWIANFTLNPAGGQLQGQGQGGGLSAPTAPSATRTTKNVTVICRNPNCSNRDQNIQLTVPATLTRYQCGVCNQPITDITQRS